ncbi:MFS transporter [Cumulibacter soli]|uniref:MFS transporter n=1 Tax=Cumulibacter soli TaxID=2546344 RepID=UPI001068988F|nr:MFS transporter [Cumulibacter soli]
MEGPLSAIEHHARRRPTIDAIAAASAAVLPLYLTAGLAVQIGRDLELSTGQLGIASTAFFGAQAVMSPFVGALVARFGAVRSMRLSMLLAAAVAVAIGVAADGLLLLLLALVLGGANNALAKPATNQFIADAIPAGSQGAAFGLKQSAIPVASLLAGLAVPLLGLTLGWRWAFIVFALLLLGLSLREPGGPRRAPRALPDRPVDGSISRSSLLMLTISSGIASACGTSFGVYLVSGAVATGWSEGAAGILFAAASLCGIIARALAGWLADRRTGRHVATVAAMMIAGAGGALLLAIGSRPTYLLGALVAYSLGWGWPGLFIFAVVRLNPARPAGATAFVQAGTAVGAVAGPALFGLWVIAHSFETAWLGVGIALICAGLVSLLARRRIAREKAAQGGCDRSDATERGS